MKNKFGPILLIVIIVSLIGTVVSAIIFDRNSIVEGVHRLQNKIVSYGDDFFDSDKEEKGIDISNIKKISIDINSGTVDIKKGLKNTLKFEGFNGNHSIEGDKLNINGNVGNIKIVLTNPELTEADIKGNNVEIDIEPDLKLLNCNVNKFSADIESAKAYPININANFATLEIAPCMFNDIYLTSKGYVAVDDGISKKDIYNDSVLKKGTEIVKITLNKGTIESK